MAGPGTYVVRARVSGTSDLGIGQQLPPSTAILANSRWMFRHILPLAPGNMIQGSATAIAQGVDASRISVPAS
jgi:hypothetical protein